MHPLLNSWVSANHDKVERFQPIVKTLYPLMCLYCKNSLFLIDHYFNIISENIISAPKMQNDYTVGENIIATTKIRTL